MKQKSVIGRTVFMMTMQCFLLIIVFLSYVFFSYRTAAESLESNMQNLIRLYGKELENKLENSDMLLERLIYKNNDYDMLQSEDESGRYHAAVRIKSFIQEQITYDPYVDAVVISESTYGSCLDYDNSKLSLKAREALRQFTMERAKLGREKAAWGIEEIGGDAYIYKMYVWQGRAAGIFISVDHFMENAFESDFEKVTILLLDENKNIWGYFGNKILEQNVGETWAEPSHYRIKKAEHQLAEGKMFVYICTSMSEITGQIRWNMLLVLFGILILVVFSGLLVRFLRKEIIIPLRHMQKSMEVMREGDYTLRIREEYRNREFTLLKDVFNRLMDEIVGLKIKSYEKQIEFQEAELKSIRLQIRPHFFLNAVTTISSLSQQGKNKEIQQYISALSKNIRYMFRSGMHTVALGEEVAHVENYFAMQELKYPNCVFYYIDISEELKEWRVPQMLIHTIIENEYKYAVAVDKILTILIKASITKVQGEAFLLLEIEDDGGGYPNEVLHQFAENEMHVTSNGERVGLWSIKRMMNLMYEREGLFQISNIKPHGCKNAFLIPGEAVREFEESTDQE